MTAANPQIRCLSIPQASLTRQRDKAAQILHWWQEIEQATIDLALDYNYVLHADIADCYGSIYTHSIGWALHDRSDAKKRQRDGHLLGNRIDWMIQDMQQGQTNGIPQGSVLMDMIAEMVLGYADLNLTERLSQLGNDQYQILRYRDDYRILVNNSLDGERILKLLTEVLIDLGLKLNVSKTTGVQPVILGAVKRDKREWMRSRQSSGKLQEQLMLIHAHGTDFPNAGTLLAPLSDFYRRLSRLKSVSNPMQLISITIDIGYNNPRCFPVCAAIVSKLLSRLATDREKEDAVQRIRRKIGQLPNSGFLELWLQRITYPLGLEVPYNEKLCKLVGGENVELWTNAWVRDTELRQMLAPTCIVDEEQLKRMGPIVKRAEFEVFYPYWG